MALSAPSTNFSGVGYQSPVITSNTPMGADALQQNTQQAIQNIGGYLKDQQGKVQDLQTQQAGDLSKALIMAQQYYPQAVPVIQGMMKQNPYSRRAFGNQQQGSMGQAGQMGGNPNIFASMIGAPGANSLGQGLYPTTANGTADSSAGGGVSQNPVVTSATMGGGKPPEYTVKNPGAEQTMEAASAAGGVQGKASQALNQSLVSGSESVGSTMGAEQANANIGAIRQDVNLQRTAQSLSNLTDLHKQLSDAGAAGNAWSEWVADHYNEIPNNGEVGTPKGMRDSYVTPKVQNLLGQFQAARNETMISTQPQLTAQFDKAGTSRIMESVLDLTKQEYGDLNTPHNEFVGKTQGTMGTMFRMDNATQQYYKDLQQSGMQLPTERPNPNNDPAIDAANKQIEQQTAQAIAQRFPKATLTPEQQSQLDYLNKQVTGSAAPKGGSVNPVMGQQNSQQGKQTTQASKQPQFVNGKVYQDAKGNTATYQNGQWIESK